MEVERIIHYILIENLVSGKIIYEMTNIIGPKVLYEANLIFSSFQKKKHHSQNTKINSFTVSIFIDNIIMIMKTDELYPIERSFDLFKKIKKSVPNLYELSLDWNLNLYKQSLSEKITKIIYDYFSDLNSSRKILNTVSYIKNDINDIIEEESDENKMESSVSSKNSNNNNNKNKKRNSLISSNDGDKISLSNIKLDKTVFVKERKSKIFDKSIDNNKSKRISVKMIDDNENNKTNMYKSLIQSSSLVRINNNENDKMRNTMRESHMTNKYVSDLKNIVTNISCCKRFIIFFIVLVIIIQVVAIPLIILYSYSY